MWPSHKPMATSRSGPRRVERGRKISMNDLIAQAAADGLESRAVMPGRELGAYEVLGARP
jgi:hypothetical protein